MIDFNADDKVVVIHTPYDYSVPNGTIAIIEDIKENHFGKGHHLYVLANLRCKAFREHELRLMEAILK